jgi:mono/diheme cytochrome c family protein
MELELSRSKEDYPVKTIAGLFLILALSLAACGGGALKAAAPSTAPAGNPAAWEKIFASACAACHGLKGQGIPGLSQDMTQSQPIATKTDQELAEFIKTGGVPGEAPVMLPKGGLPTLTDQNLVDIVAYIRTLQK